VQNVAAATEEERVVVESMREVNREIGGRPLFGDGRLSAVFAGESADFTKVYQWGVKHGRGSVEVREEMKRRLEDIKSVGERAHLSLSGRGRFVSRTYNMQFVR
jgi:hypothetical protein